jgi:4'-phosphopantetheinyl transferase
MLPLNTQQIDLWCTFPNEVSDPALLETYRQLLSSTEQQQQQRFHFAKHRHRYLLTRALARTMLSRYTAIPAEQLVFQVNQYNKPFIANHAISFNITHTDDLIILGVTRDNALGIDTENKHREITTELAEYSFASEEAADFLTQSLEQRQQRFFEYWTLKESYIKARGMGLAIPLKEFSFHFPEPHKIEFTAQNDTAERWRFWQLQLAENYLVAVCVEKNNVELPLLKLKQVVPLVSEKSWDYQLLRTSP